VKFKFDSIDNNTNSKEYESVYYITVGIEGVEPETLGIFVVSPKHTNRGAWDIRSINVVEQTTFVKSVDLTDEATMRQIVAAIPQDLFLKMLLQGDYTTQHLRKYFKFKEEQ